MSGVIGQSKRLITKYMRREVTDKVPSKTIICIMYVYTDYSVVAKRPLRVQEV